ncbi:MAG TPA: ABC transporter permease [Gammaproteobacteria bacterium]|nr:ABC transporter permease [Gammaproteobacteria bacterium]
MSIIGLDSAARDLRYTLRGLARRPAFTFAAVLTLALGIGATTAIFSVVYGVLLKPLPYPDPDRLVSVRHTNGLTSTLVGIADSMFVTYAQENRVFEYLGGWGENTLALTGAGEPEQIRSVSVGEGVLEALGVQPVLGRWFSADEYASGAAGVNLVILSYGLWQRRFGGDPSVLGRTLSLNSEPAQVVGVMPKGFRFLSSTPDVILGPRRDAAPARPLTLGRLNAPGIARLKPGVTVAEANADLARMLPIWLDAWPEPRPGFRDEVIGWRIVPAVRPLKDEVVGGVAGMLWVVMGTVGTVLLIACANIANLLLARADARRHELAIRAALGAGRGKIAAELLRESLVLGALGGAAGLALASAALELLAAFAPPHLPRVEDIGLGPAVLAFAAAASLVSSLAFGAIPALKHALASGSRVGPATRNASASREHNRTRGVLIAVQVAFALVLLVGAGLMIRTFVALIAVDPGFRDPAKIQLAQIWIPPALILDAERWTGVYREIGERIAALPGVSAVGFGGGLPGGGGSGGVFTGPALSVEDRPETGESVPVSVGGFSPGYFAALGTRFVAGRDLAWTDVDRRARVALVTENLAREVWGEPRAALGKRIRTNAADEWSEVVGVTQDVFWSLYQPPAPHVSTPIVPVRNGLRTTTYVIRSDRAGTESLANEIREAVWASNPDLTVYEVRTLADRYRDSLARTSFVLVLLAISGAMALILSVVGIYGVISYIVSQRTREIGIRLALGAQADAVKGLFVRYALAVSAIGIAAGLAGAAALSRWMTSLLFEVRPLDPATYAAVLGVLVGAVLLAAYLPARRAAKLDPAETLRAE